MRVCYPVGKAIAAKDRHPNTSTAVLLTNIPRSFSRPALAHQSCDGSQFVSTRSDTLLLLLLGYPLLVPA